MDGFTESLKEIGYQGVRAGELVIHSMDGFAGAMGVSDSDGKMSPVVHIYAVPDDNPYYVAHVLRVAAGSGFIQSLAKGIRERSTSFDKSTFKDMALPRPPRSEQDKIVAYLDRETARIDTLIEEQQRLIDLLRERRAAILSSSLESTHGWVRYRIKHIGEAILGKMLDSGRAIREGDEFRPYVRAADVRAGGSVNLADLNEMPFSVDEMATFELRAGDILLVEGGATGRPGFLFDAAPGIAFQKTVNRLRVGELADARFVYWSMLRLYESDYYANHYGSVSFVHLTAEKLREIELLLPSLDEQRRIAAYLDAQTAKIDALIAEAEQFIELSKERRAALITAAVTGQIDLREVA
ncbi:type I restriction enzyme S subunit [Actinoalloteichus hoggarensis]|uniref:restriction endonuclease subunit S n=1 Tax=Actinoalloteichus hoggarensis TaxID=1470176 RepID=UPI0012FD4956|nr:restriction endonuclease subunit S [Actinoalloteichus hoggarensis]MBB5920187.1 type I restriction enzyme S subunit [Actinoalloteichus hoggarensis]